MSDDVIHNQPVMSIQSVSSPLQGGVRFLRYLIPAPLSACLAVRLLALLRERYRLALFHVIDKRIV
ncbi:hypothetical protein DW080_04935 [Bacteroides caccae]|uniref:Uncharacterized protein n=6 Tax=Bacteroides TaxID=816 RepID=A0A413DWB1_BACSE|nr:hypothetical protein F3B64_16405 [Bacteroides ovatus]RGD53594.1 hypothetical protein DW096_09355 [Bacteroides sp. AM07-18]RGJ27607.1 hypothetical protein DXD65_20790 [Bacteroides sp. 4_1_36]RGJ91552.1 hypothetical protein DXD40_14685 [Bacteroides uniformis]RGU38046.1 hypothetical protein DWW78_01000 [Alistipes indistinctus]RGW94266.1 hypothetical protein DWV41_14755 [Bacteroides stercoris]RGX76900.1 hypothetical protein DXA68_17870 [Bacteroides stercorirosoris]RHC11755.1 hypothetical prot